MPSAGKAQHQGTSREGFSCGQGYSLRSLRGKRAGAFYGSKAKGQRLASAKLLFRTAAGALFHATRMAFARCKCGCAAFLLFKAAASKLLLHKCGRRAVFRSRFFCPVRAGFRPFGGRFFQKIPLRTAHAVKRERRFFAGGQGGFCGARKPRFGKGRKECGNALPETYCFGQACGKANAPKSPFARLATLLRFCGEGNSRKGRRSGDGGQRVPTAREGFPRQKGFATASGRLNRRLRRTNALAAQLCGAQIDVLWRSAAEAR